MPRFAYRARDRSGTAIDGEVEAPDLNAALEAVSQRGLMPTQLEPVAEGGGGLEAQWQQLRRRLLDPKVTTDDLVLFVRQLHALLKAGVPLIRALHGLAESTRNRTLSRTIRGVADRLEGGYSVGDAMAGYPEVFPGLLVALIRVGEASGRLEESLQRMAANLEQERKTRTQVKQALRYPTFVMIAIVVAIGVVNVFVIPAFSGVFDHFDAELPLPTRVLIATSDFTVAYWPHLLAALVGFAWAVRTYVRSESGRMRWDYWKLRLPVVGGILLRALLARFARTLSMALRSGVPVLSALSAVAATTDNAYIARGIEQMRDGIERGESLYRVAEESQLFTPLVLQMLAVGEETGQVSDMMDEVAEFYEGEVAVDLEKLSASIEPIVISLIGALVLILALGIFLPMWQMGQAAL